jgi:hypothetical protein
VAIDPLKARDPARSKRGKRRKVHILSKSLSNLVVEESIGDTLQIMSKFSHGMSKSRCLNYFHL